MTKYYERQDEKPRHQHSYHGRQAPRMKNKFMVRACLIKDKEAVGGGNKTLKAFPMPQDCWPG